MERNKTLKRQDKKSSTKLDQPRANRISQITVMVFYYLHLKCERQDNML